MLLSKSFKPHIRVSALLLAILTARAACASAVSLEDAAAVFLRRAAPESVCRALAGSAGGDELVRVAESGSGVYAFSAGKARHDRDGDVRRELELADAGLHAMRARRALALRLSAGRLDRKRYPDDDALGDALLSHLSSGVTGLQSASDISEGWAMALVWFEPEAAEAARAAMPEQDELKTGYCAFLYERAKIYFDTGRYAEALPIFKHIHDFRWANVGAYTDAAECFLKMGEPAESLKLLKELVGTLGGGMGSDELLRAGRLFRETGDRAAALSAIKLARERFRQGR